jgi:hypothetical protein
MRQMGRMRASAWIPIVLWGAMTFVAPACSRCLGGSPSSGTTCQAAGGATLTAGQAAPQAVYVWYGMSCFNAATCNLGLSIGVHDTATANPGALDVTVNLPATMGDFSVANPTTFGYWNAAPDQTGSQLDPLTFVSGSTEVHGASEAGFTATFAMELRTAANESIAITDGQATVTGCHIVESCGE